MHAEGKGEAATWAGSAPEHANEQRRSEHRRRARRGSAAAREVGVEPGERNADSRREASYVPPSREELDPPQGTEERAQECTDRDHEVTAGHGEQVRQPARLEGLAIGRLEVRLTEDERSSERSCVSGDRRLDAPTDVHSSGIDRPSKAARSLDADHVEHPSARMNGRQRLGDARVLVARVVEALGHPDVGDELEDVPAADLFRRTMQAYDEGRGRSLVAGAIRHRESDRGAPLEGGPFCCLGMNDRRAAHHPDEPAAPRGSERGFGDPMKPIRGLERMRRANAPDEQRHEPSKHLESAQRAAEQEEDRDRRRARRPRRQHEGWPERAGDRQREGPVEGWWWCIAHRGPLEQRGCQRPTVSFQGLRRPPGWRNVAPRRRPPPFEGAVSLDPRDATRFL